MEEGKKDRKALKNECMVDAKDIFKTVLETRNFEISMFWKRSNYFLALNTAIALGFFKLNDNEIYSFLLAALGTWASFLWCAVCLGGKFWQDRWEYRLRVIEKKYIEEGILPKYLDLFSADWPTVYNDVNSSLKYSNHKWLRRQFDKQIMMKYSVSSAMIYLSFSFVIGWLIVAIVNILL